MSAQVTLGLDASRALDPARYAIGGSVPRAAVRPASRDEAVEAMKAAARDRLAVVPWGAGTGLAREQAPARYDLALDLGALDRLVEYEPEDMTLTAECGITLATLRGALAARGQELPLEGAHEDRATLGGALACNAAGPRRLRFGAPYDRILGARFVLGDGTAARTGGRVVKNVTGYAVHRLLCGSRGGLGVMLEASLKLMPAPERRVMLEYEMTAAALADAARWAALPRLEPAGLTVTTGERGFGVAVGLEDESRWVSEQEAAVVAALGTPARRLEGDAVRARWRALAEATDREGAALDFATASNTPSALGPLLEREPRGGFVFHALAGRLHLFPAAGPAQDLVAALAATGFALIGARGVEATPVPPPQTGVRQIRERLREALDPGDIMAFGERWVRGG